MRDRSQLVAAAATPGIAAQAWREGVSKSEQMYISEAVKLCFDRTLNTPVKHSRIACLSPLAEIQTLTL